MDQAATGPLMSAADRRAHELASYVREVYDAFPAGGPRGSWPAEERAQELREQGQPATVVMDLPSDRFLVVEAGER